MVSRKLSREKLQEALVGHCVTIEQTLKAMDNEVAIIVDDAGRMCGLVTDGDIRRAFLGGATMETPIRQIMSPHPFAIQEDDCLSPGEIMALMLKHQIRHLPVIDYDGFPVGLELLRDQYNDDDLAPAVLMAGGKGSRLYPLTAETPKPLLKVGDQTIIDNVIAGLKSCGVKNIAVSINYLGEKIKQHLGTGDDELRLKYLEEKEALGTAGALSLLSPRPDRAFIVMNADLMTEVDYKAFVRFHKNSGNQLSVGVRRIEEKIPFGVIDLDEHSGELRQIREKPVNTYFINAGIYMLEPQLLELIPAQQFFDMVALINAALARGYKVGAFPILEYWRDIGRHQEIAQARQEWRQRRQPVTTTVI